jgi:hypothetical protein
MNATTLSSRLETTPWSTIWVRGLTQSRLVILLLVLGAVPLLLPTVPPLIDLPNHMSRYAIGLDYATSPYFRQWFDFHWVLVGNLGVDLLVTALAPALGVELATKIVIIATPVITIGGALLVAREVHGRIPLTAAFAAVFAYNWPFNFGFVNFCLAAGMALLAFGLWLRMGRLGQHALRMALFVPIGFAVWVAHAAGWGILGVLIFSWEVMDAQPRVGWVRAIVRAVICCLPLTLPLVPMLFWSAALPKGSLSLFVFDATRKIAIVLLTLRNGNPPIDLGSTFVILGACIAGILRKDLAYDRRLAVVGFVLLLVFIAMPVNLMGSGHADLRIAPYAVMLFPLALRPTAETQFTRWLGIGAIAFFTASMAYHAVSYFQINRMQEHQLEALDHLPIGSRVFALSRVSCAADMAGYRMDHVHRLAVVRRQAFTNGTWPYPASQTLIVHPDMVAGYADESSQLIQQPACLDGKTHTVNGALAAFPHDRYQYLWMLDMPASLRPSRPWLQPVWQNDSTVLYRIVRAG